MEHSQRFGEPLWFPNHGRDTISALARTTASFGLKGRPLAFTVPWCVCTYSASNSLSCASTPPRLERVCCKTTAAFLATSSTTLLAPRCLPRRIQTICFCRTSMNFSTFPEVCDQCTNTSLPQAIAPTLCLGTARWRRSPKLFDTSSRLGICWNRFSFYPPHAFDKIPGLAPRQPRLKASFPRAHNYEASLLFSVTRGRYFIEIPVRDTASLKISGSCLL